MHMFAFFMATCVYEHFMKFEPFSSAVTSGPPVAQVLAASGCGSGSHAQQLQRSRVSSRKQSERKEAELVRSRAVLHRKESETTEFQRVMVDHAAQQHELSELKVSE